SDLRKNGQQTRYQDPGGGHPGRADDGHADLRAEPVPLQRAREVHRQEADLVGGNHDVVYPVELGHDLRRDFVHVRIPLPHLVVERIADWQAVAKAHTQAADVLGETTAELDVFGQRGVDPARGRDDDPLDLFSFGVGRWRGAGEL